MLGYQYFESRMSADEIILQVEPQEKKKTPKGRAKKRITYTRRFVNVTLTGGKRKVCLPTKNFLDLVTNALSR